MANTLARRAAAGPDSSGLRVEAGPVARAGGSAASRAGGPGAASRAGRLGAALALAAALGGCGTVGGLFGGGTTDGTVRGFAGAVAAEEPRAALVARDTLARGGSATDAAVAAGFALTVTLPSRAGLGGGGVCVVFDPRRNQAEAVLFPPGANPSPAPQTDRPAAAPMMARGLFALHTRGGRLPFESLVAPAEGLARFGTEVSRAFATDLAAVSRPLFADPAARAVFSLDGRPPAEGERIVQADLAATLGQMRTAGVGDLHQGVLARRLADASRPAGGGLTVEALRAALPQVVPARAVASGLEVLSVPPTPAGDEMAAAFAARAAGRAVPAPGGAARPASTALAVLDRDGGAVACAFTMNNLFGTGRVAAGTGILLAAAPGVGPEPLLAAGVLHAARITAFRAAAAGSGQEGAAAAAGAALALAAAGQAEPASLSAAVPGAGRAVAIGCPRYLPGNADLCRAAVDPRGAGVALLVSGR
ncbi:MAG: gamma-glutamyltransferase [Acetobacteraceae bacterium]